jgi:hypothetical protein
MTISADIMERCALGPSEGYDTKLVAVSGTHHAGGRTAENYVHGNLGVPRTDIVGSEYAGRSDAGDQVYLVTWKLPGKDES